MQMFANPPASFRDGKGMVSTPLIYTDADKLEQ